MAGAEGVLAPDRSTLHDEGQGVVLAALLCEADPAGAWGSLAPRTLPRVLAADRRGRCEFI